MGLFDFFKGKSNKDKGDKGDSDKKEKKSSPAAKWAEAAGNKRAQAPDRQEALQELAKLKSPDAVEALLKRFTFAIDPSITDQEEKEFAYEGIVGAGKDAAIEPVRAFAVKAESVQWPIKILKELCEEDELVDELIKWLGRWDTEYAKFMDPKLQILDALGDYKNPKIREAVEPFLQDVTDDARNRAVTATLTQADPASLEPLIESLVDTESVRTKNKILDGIANLGWEIPEDKREPVRKVLPYEYGIDGAGKITKRG